MLVSNLISSKFHSVSTIAIKLDKMMCSPGHKISWQFHDVVEKLYSHYLLYLSMKESFGIRNEI